MRFTVVSFPHWPLTAKGISSSTPAATVVAGKISVTTPAARGAGVTLGQRRREALRCCPELQLLESDPAGESQSFLPVLDALYRVVARIETSTPGLVAFNSVEPVRFYGSEEAVLHQICAALDHLDPLTHEGTHIPIIESYRVGCADSRFAAQLAGDTNQPIVAPGQTADFLSDYRIETLGHPDFATLAHRLGIHTIGQFAQLSHRSVATRFGASVAAAHVIAQGTDPVPLTHYVPVSPVVRQIELDPPVQRTDMAAFAAKQLADDLTQEMTAQGCGCTGVVIELETEHGESDSRRWHTSIGFDAESIVERVRWQLGGWLDDRRKDRPTAGMSLIRITVLEVADSADLQLGLWGELSSSDRRAMRGLDRLRGLLGDEAVFTARVNGGRDPAAATSLSPWGHDHHAAPEIGPWPGQIPQPSPSIVYPQPISVQVSGTHGPIGVSARGRLTEQPKTLRITPQTALEVTGWAGPWLADELWWESNRHRRLARIQMTVREFDGTQRAYLLRVQAGQWHIEAAYD